MIVISISNHCFLCFFFFPLPLFLGSQECLRNVTYIPPWGEGEWGVVSLCFALILPYAPSSVSLLWDRAPHLIGLHWTPLGSSELRAEPTWDSFSLSLCPFPPLKINIVFKCIHSVGVWWYLVFLIYIPWLVMGSNIFSCVCWLFR